MRQSVVDHTGRIAALSLLLVLVGLVAATGTVAADGGFEVEITDVPDTVDENGDLEIEAEIRNTGTDTTTQELRLEDGDGTVLQSKSQVLGGGQSVTDTFVWSDVPGRPTRTITPTVRSEDDSDSASTTVEWTEFEVRELDLSRDAVAGGDPVTVTGEVRNIGTAVGTQELVFTDVSGNIDTESVTLDGAESTDVTFDVTAPTDPGTYTYSLSTANGSADRSLRVLESAAFDVTITETTTDETGFELVATVENEGEIEGIEDVTFSVDGETVTTRSVTAQPNETLTETFSYDTGSKSFAVEAAVETGATTDTTQVSRAAIDEGPAIEAVTPAVVRNDGVVTVTYTAAGPAVDAASLTVTDPNGEPLVSRAVDPGTERTTTVRLPGRDELVAGQYDVELTAEDDSGRSESTSRANAFEAEPLRAADDVGFSRERYETPAGDFVEVDVSAGDREELYVLVAGPTDGGDAAGRYLDVLHVSGDATFVVNTRLVGTDRPSTDVYIPVDGEVTSYAHSIGADSEPQGAFDGLSFRNEDGTERADTLAAFRDEQGHTALERPLQPGEYRLVAAGSGAVLGGDGTAGVRHPIARANLALTPPELGAVRTYTLPPAAADRLDQSAGDAVGVDDIGPLLARATETDTVAEGDRLLIEIQSTGIYGALMADTAATNPAVAADSDGSGAIPAGDVATLLDRREGVRLELTGTSASGGGSSELRFGGVDSNDLYVLPDDSADQWPGSDAVGTEPRIGGLYLVVDTRDNEAFNGRPTPGDELTVEVSYESSAGDRYAYPDASLVDGDQPAPFSPAADGTEQFPYASTATATVSVTDSFVVTEPGVAYDETTLDGELLVPAEADGVITGETTIAPGSTAELRLAAADGESTVTIEDVEIGPDRSFEATGEFSAFEPGEDVEAAFYSAERTGENRLLDSRSVRVVEDLDDPARFEIGGVPESVSVDRGERLGDIAATVTNTGEFADRQRVAFSVDGETVREQSTVLDSGESTTLALAEEFVVLPAGEYRYTVSTDDARRTGTLTVTDGGDAGITADDGGATQSTPPEEDGSDGEGTGLFGMVGLRGRDVAAAALVTAGTYVLGQWA
ncbi:BGTF surface domain-containing protein [Halohasta salina]|uniref:BGTF surface domain-containing protein n=1 Tax=Halohasta salina TaxID=2961621 RepID=UPI0020A310AD|nr:BGTF surface domain-containing protein [Halohasta salina]